MENIATFVLAALALVGSPGPNTLSLAAVGAAFERPAAIRYMLGLNLGLIGVIVIVGSGVSGLLLALPGAAPLITTLAAAYFLFLAYRIATAPPLGEQSHNRREPRWFEGTLLSLINPKAYAAMAALYSGFVLVAGNALSDAIAKAAVLLLTITPINVAWLMAGAALTRVFRNERTSRILNVTFAVLLIASVLMTAFL